MKTKLIAALILGSFVLAGCGGGGSGGLSMSEEDELRQQLEEAETALDEAETALDEAEAEAQRQAQADEAARQQAEAARIAAEAEQARLQQEADEAQAALNREQAQDALASLTAALTPFTGTVSPKYRAQATVTGIGPFASSSGSTDGGWYVTRFTNLNRSNEETLVVYSDVGPPTSELLTETYEGDFTAFGDTNLVVKTVEAADSSGDDASLIASPSFPRNAVASDAFTPTIDSDLINDADSDGNPANDYDTVRLSGTFDGASGNFYCEGTDCIATHFGGNVYSLTGGGGWTFRASKTARVSVPDDSHTRFGWWKNANLETDAFSFSIFRNGVGSPHSLFTSLEGTYTYRGRAAGQYALYSPIAASSSTGEFTADAMLQASFGATDTISGSITGISGQPGWSLTLNETTIENTGAFTNASDGIVWSIDGYTETGGNWAGQFYFDAEVGAVPTAAVGTFTGHYGDEGRIIGAFGAH